MPTYSVYCNGNHSMTTRDVGEFLKRLSDLRNAVGPVTATKDGAPMSLADVWDLERDFCA